MGAVYLGPLCRADFKVSEGAANVCGVVADFAALPLVLELFWKTSLKDMIRSIEVNAAKTLMLSCAIDADISHGFTEIQQRVDAEHARSEALSAERDSLSERVKTLEAQVADLEVECTALQGDVQDLWGVRATLVKEIQVERDLSTAVGLSTWKAMEALEEAVTELGAIPPVRRHRPTKMDITLECLQRANEVCLAAARAYGDHYVKVAWLTTLASLDKAGCAHYVKVAWLTTLASLDKAGCAHLDVLAARSVAVATAEEVATAQRRTRKASKILQQDFWALRGHEAATESFWAVQAQQAKGKAPAGTSAEDPEAAKRGSTHGDKV